MRIESKFIKTFSFIFLALMTLSGQSQISGGELKPEKEKKEKGEKVKREKKTFVSDSLSGTAYYLGAMGQWSFRSFEDQTTNDIHAKLNDEIPMYTGGFRIGTVVPLAGRLGLDVGLTYFAHGEAYQFDDPDSDSSYSYTNVYMQAGIPLALRYTYGQDFQVFGFAGVAPLNILNIRKKINFTRADGTAQPEELISTKQDFTQFNLMASGGLGINYYFLNYIGVSLSLEYRRHLLNTFSEDTFKRDHKMYGVGVGFSVQVRI